MKDPGYSPKPPDLSEWLHDLISEEIAMGKGRIAACLAVQEQLREGLRQMVPIIDGYMAGELTTRSLRREVS